MAHRARLGQSTISRAEGGRRVALDDLIAIATLVGVDLAIRAYPGGTPLRDAAHLRLAARLRALFPVQFRWQMETPIPLAGDQRAVDAILVDPPLSVGFELESRLLDAQALVRRIGLKQRDARLERMILVLADTQSNRVAARAADATLRASFPLSGRALLADLRHRRMPPGSGLLFV